jgi:hypothetical protein
MYFRAETYNSISSVPSAIKMSAFDIVGMCFTVAYQRDGLIKGALEFSGQLEVFKVFLNVHVCASVTSFFGAFTVSLTVY